MKILLLNPHTDAAHKISETFSAVGAALLSAITADEAWQLLQLHGKSVDLAIVHREGLNGPEDGLKFIERVKADPAQSDLPFIVTSSQWHDDQFARHQATPQGANAYIHWPCADDQLLALVSALFGDIGQQSVASAMGSEAPPEPAVQSLDLQPLTTGGGVVLEEAAFAPGEVDTAGIRLDAPEVSRDLGSTKSGILISEMSKAEIESPGFNAQLTKTKPVSALLDEHGGQPGAAPDPAVLKTATLGVPTMTIALGQPPGGSEATATSSVAPESGSNASLPALEVTGGTPILPPGPPVAASGAPVVTGEPALVLPDHLLTQELEPSVVLAATSVGIAPPPFTPPPPEEPAVDDQELASEMPYLFAQKGIPPRPGQKAAPAAPDLSFAQPLGDAVVPGGAAQTPDTETLKKYLLLREQDVAVLSSQLKESQEQIRSLEAELKTERGSQTELSRTIEDQLRRIGDFEREKSEAVNALQSEITELRFELRARSDKGRLLDQQMREAKDEIERVKERVRSDIRKIRVREKELENRLELIKKDSEALLAARENKIIELKRKIDLLEFNMDLLQDQFGREKEVSSDLRERLAKAAQVVRVAGGLLHENDGTAGGNAGNSTEGGQKAS